ncbi:phosphopantothenoylcysteine decarboxylase/phosphopantothenate--cysteine ligase [Halovivax ruber XH-70]|uniref:Coenzyme A biosynthesis bifunctional protein CoaBC n=1 Tax=Halovivax ruber (strain DSM 18193 / JCM 13892 / XH-70) TaxID=797302 RepID=L0IA43_HALRX|nr:bifunctional phosphopantothenoylcysteine decarboxylase/phosphopantothenate--cysteine ligase CoaBC [Halovivax ruber]AGB15698.1 phosphopantothenoylcysteine decarboxylase/phosphopantothenate--cysteine ligase [Halovivax ruber XH-70]
MPQLEDVNVVLGVTGSIAAVKTVELAHELRRRGASVKAVMSESASGIVHPNAVGYATGNEAVTELSWRVEHVELCGRDGWADVLLIAPATANTVGKLAAAIDDTPVTTTATTALGADVPVVVAPAMHEPMYDHPGVLASLERIESWGVDLVDPRIEEEKAKIATEDAICTAVARATGETPLAGEHVVVTAGATAEAIDPVRVLTNRSSGRMGRAVARACYVRGADVTLIHGPIGPHSVEKPANSHDETLPDADVISVETTAEMIEATRSACETASVLVSAAALADYTTDERDGKIRSGTERELTLEPTAKLIDTVRADRPDLPIVGFKTETSGDEQAMIDAARDVLDRVGLAFVVANDASVMGEDETSALLVHAGDVASFTGTKADLAEEIARSLGQVV